MERDSRGIFIDLKLVEFIEHCIDDFFRRRLIILRSFNLKESLTNINPYIYKIDRNFMAGEIVERLVNDYIRTYDKILFDYAFIKPLARISKTESARDTEPVFNIYEEVPINV